MASFFDGQDPYAGLNFGDAMAGWRRSMAQEIAAELEGELQREFAAYLKPRGRPKQAISPQLKKINRAAATVAMSAMMSSYNSRPNQRAPYRIGDRYSGGRLARALEDDKNVRIKPTSFSFMHIAHMDSSAPQWYPMSFGWNGSEAGVRPAVHPETGRTLPSSPTLAEWGAVNAEFNLPGNLEGSWYIRKRREIHVSSLEPGGKGQARRREPLSGLKIDAYGFVQEGVSAVNEFYPDQIYHAVLNFLDPKYRP